ncbi:DNA-binding transcriptional regulator, LysR family [Cognatiyoonia sediminum]|uniref:DNA-binding transcriptional regulator, LysR family n=1 Tax=Cognatiyoonia sediminum TaxID=1508389 RepID=A0A1M5SUW5_9RHOB|nr:LysR family transcriptional regulator [Cognatiyoonia sediminum]SHH42351.1 DNA-binding transcriptional regulator, LysR family [Cognatiyoonia sediminum]
MHSYLRHLANFARIVEAGSMKSASEALGISPSGLSDSVKLLENRFGTSLLIRHKLGVTPTTEGERVYASASGIVDLMNEALGPDASDELDQACRISVPTEIANTCFGSVVRYLVKHHPRLSLKIFAEDELIDHSRFARDYFLRIAPTFPQEQELRTVWTGKANAILVASAELISEEDANNIKRISELPAIVDAERSRPFQYRLSNPKGVVTCASAIGVSHPSAQLRLACQGLGVTGCIDLCAAGLIEAGLLRQVLSNRFGVPLEIRLMTPHRRKMRSDAALRDAMNQLEIPT